MSHELLVNISILLLISIFFISVRGLWNTWNHLNSELKTINDELFLNTTDQVATRILREKCRHIFKKSGTLFHQWVQFEHHITPLDPVEDKRHYSTHDPREFFNLENLIEGTKNKISSTTIWTAIPQVLTSIGIIGTFISIFMSLGSAPDSISDGFIKTLVSSVAKGFHASMFGVGLSVAFVIVEKLLLRDLEIRLNEVVKTINFFFPTITADVLIVDQNHILKNLSAEIASSISKGFTEMSGTLGPALADMIDDETKATIKTGVASSFAEMNMILVSIRDESKNLFTELQEIRSARNQILDSIKQTTEFQNSLQQQINTQSNTLVENLKALEATLQPLKEVSRQVQATNDLSDKLISSIDQIKVATTSVRETVEKSSASVSSFTPQIEKLSLEYKDLVTSIEEWVTKSNGSLENNLASFDKHIASVLDRVSVLSNTLHSGVTKLDSSFQKWSEFQKTGTDE